VVSPVREGLTGQDKVGYLLRLVDLDVVPGVVEQVQFGVREQGGEAGGDAGVEVPVAGTEDHPYRWAEAAHVGDSPPPTEDGCDQVIVESLERGPGGQELVVQLRDELRAQLRIVEEPADLPGVKSPVQVQPPPDDGAGGSARMTGVEYKAMAGGRRRAGVQW